MAAVVCVDAGVVACVCIVFCLQSYELILVL